MARTEDLQDLKQDETERELEAGFPRMGDAPGLENEATEADLDVVADGETAAERTVLKVLAERFEHGAECAGWERRGARLEREVEGDRLVDQTSGFAECADG